MSDLYEALGTSAQKEGVHAAVAGRNVGLLPGSFATVLPDQLVGATIFRSSLRRVFCSTVPADSRFGNIICYQNKNKKTSDITRRFLVLLLSGNLGVRQVNFCLHMAAAKL